MNDPDHFDRSGRFADFAAELSRIADADRTRRLVARSHRGVHLIEDGQTRLNFGSNDYLGLAGRVSRADVSVGGGSAASALVCGWTEPHRDLADRIAAFESMPAAIVFPSGFAACQGVTATLPRSGDLILSDRFNHASLIDGCRLSRAEVKIYPHRDVECVQSYLQTHRKRYARVWILTDGVFSMDGDVAPLPDLCDVAERHGADVVVDEAHATGVLGDRGGGACEALGVADRVAVRIGTLSKAVGGQGGFAAGPRVLIDYLIQRCRSLIYSTALAPAAVAVAAANLATIDADPSHRLRVNKLSRRLRSRLHITWDESSSAQQVAAGVPIIPVVIGSEAATLDASRQLSEAGFYVPAIRPPTVPDGESRLRISLSANHDDAMIDALADALGRATTLEPGLT